MSIFRPFQKLVLSIAIVGCASPLAAADSAHLQLPMSVEDSRHLLMRTGLGAAPSDVEALRGLSRVQAIEVIVQGMSAQPDVPMPDWVEQPLPLYHARRDMDDESRARFNNARDAEFAQLREWWVLNMLETTSPQTERLVLFWHDLFATNYHDLGKQTLAMARQNQTFRSLGFGSWDRFLKAMIRDAALLRFLNSGSNHKASPNENLARELMELFVLGEGNYDESTVREAARALTGHDTSQTHDLQFRLKTWAQDRKEKTLFGQRGDFDGDDLVEVLLAQEAAPRFLATRFWHAFVSDSPPDAAWLERQALMFRQSGLDIATLYTNVLQSAEFWHADKRGAIIKSPVDIVVGTARTLDYPKSRWQRMPQWLRTIGMELFAPPNVAGWKEGGGFITPGYLLNRHKVIRQMTAGRASQAELTGEQAMQGGEQTMQAGEQAMQGGEQTMQAREQAMQGGKQTMQGDEQTMQGMPEQGGKMIDVELRLGAEDYRGPTQYQLHLIHDGSSLWQSSPDYFRAGRDTEQFGRVETRIDISWHSVVEKVPARHLEKATAMRVYYLNDDAGEDGDRNLYLDGISVGDNWYPANSGVQTSDCPPQLRADAGNLYCDGYVELSMDDQTNPTTSVAADDDHARQQLLASAIHVGWGAYNRINGTYSLEIFLDHLQTPSRRYHHMRFLLEKRVDQPIVLQLDTFSCWPDCIEQWPECAWTDEHFMHARHVAFPWSDTQSIWWSSQHDHQCQYQSLSDEEQQLVSSLWASLPQLLGQVSTTQIVMQQPKRWQPIIKFMIDEYHKGPASIADTPLAQTILPVEIAAEHAPPEPVAMPLSAPQTHIDTFEQLIAALAPRQLHVHQLLLPEIASADVPQLPENIQKRTGRYLKAVLESPLFQLK